MATRLEHGNFARVRLRLCLFDEVEQGGAGEDTVVHLSCVDEDAQGTRLSVLWEREVDAQVVDAASFAAVATRDLDDPRTFAAYLHAQRWNCVTYTRPRLFQAPHRAGIELHAYQLEPLRKALLLPRSGAAWPWPGGPARRGRRTRAMARGDDEGLRNLAEDGTTRPTAGFDGIFLDSGRRGMNDRHGADERAEAPAAPRRRDA